MIVEKHSRIPRKVDPEAHRNLTVAKQPMGNLPVERRAEIAGEVLARYMTGEQVADMAPDYAVSDVTIYALLLREYEDEWREAQRARALARKERAENGVRTAPDALSLARAREELRGAQWELERILRRLYGQEEAKSVVITPVLVIQTSGDGATNAPHNAIQGTVLASAIDKP